jgi:beta-galactosidase
MREIIPLNFSWYFQTFDSSHVKDFINIDDFKEVDVPHHAVEIPFNNFNETMLEGVFSYVKKIEIKEMWKNKIITLRFEGVAHKASVYINQKYVFEHKGGYTPFDVDITPFVSFGEMNELLVVVNSQEDSSIPPFGGVVDYLGYSGIYREVSLVIYENYHIKDVFIKTDGIKKIQIDVETSQPEGILVYKVKDKDLNVVVKGMVIVDNNKITIETFIDDVHLWDIDHPYLYQLELHYEINQTLMDSTCDLFGIRHAEFREDGFYLNQRKIKLIGLNRHQSYPYVGYAMPKSIQQEDADILKYGLGLNCVRTSHYPQSKHFLNRADEIGLLVFEEIPGWQHIGDETWQDQSLKDLEDMIIRDKNHPSIMLWGVRINESPDHQTFYQKTNTLARSLDSTRQTGGVRNIQHSEFLEDVYTYNDFSHTGNNPGLDPKKKITKRVPYLVTEYNGHMFPTKRYDTESKRVEHAIRHLNVINNMMDSNNHISGAIGWCMNDYNTHQEFGSGDRVCYHGVLDMFRIPKYASYSYLSQQDTTHVMEVLSTMNLGEYPGGLLPNVFVLTNVDYIKLYKNDVYIKTFYPNHKQFPHLKHPPVMIDDLIGETLAKQEGMKPKDAQKAKEIFRAITKHGNRLPLMYKIRMLMLLKKYKLTIDQGVEMFFKYTSGWGSTKLSYRFEGYKNEQLVQTVIKENLTSSHYIVDSMRDKLIIGDSYDVLSLTVKKVDQHHQILPYACDAIKIETNKHIELIGPNVISLQGGAIGFYVKSKSKGKGIIKITTQEGAIEKEVIVDVAQ